MGLLPTRLDSDYTLIFKMAYNLYLRAIRSGVVGLSGPTVNDDRFTLFKKSVYYTAAIVSTIPTP